MSWGIRITILYLAFVAMIVTMILLCSGENIDLEYKDYYARELKFQDQIDAAANEQALPESIQHQVHAEAVELTLPEAMKGKEVKGELHFFRPSDAQLDLKLPLTFDKNGKQSIARSKLSPGLYKLRINWTAENKTYFKELVLNL